MKQPAPTRLLAELPPDDALNQMLAAARADAPSDDRLAALLEGATTIETGGAASIQRIASQGMAKLALLLGGTVLVLASGGIYLGLRGTGNGSSAARIDAAPKSAAPTDARIASLKEPLAPVSPSPQAPTQMTRVAPDIKPRSNRSRKTTQRPSEPELIAQARQLLRDREWSKCLQRVREHRAQYPAGILAEEREALAIEALHAQGKVGRARALLRSFEGRTPRSTYLLHLQQVLAEDGP